MDITAFVRHTVTDLLVRIGKCSTGLEHTRKLLSSSKTSPANLKLANTSLRTVNGDIAAINDLAKTLSTIADQLDNISYIE
jgi:hypothetical protein